MRITKSDYLKGRQCGLRLWLAKHGQTEPPVESEDVWASREAEGAAVERLVEALYEDPIRISACPDVDDGQPAGWDPDAAAARTRSALENGRAVFQGCLVAGPLVAVTDLIEPDVGGWRVVEVKSSTQVVQLHDWDLAFQCEVAERAGLNVVGAGVWHLDPGYVRPDGPIDPRAILRYADRTEAVAAIRAHVRDGIDAQVALVDRRERPEGRPGPRCKANRKGKAGDRPSTCGHLDADGFCGKDLPSDWAGRLPRLAGSKADFVAARPGLRLVDLDPDDAVLGWSPAQARMIRTAHAGEPEIDTDALRRELDRLAWPVAYVDFEFDPGVAVPRFAGTRPYARLPFQWSMHVQPEPGAALQAPEPFLHLGDDDPRRPFIDSLLAALPERGSIVVHSRNAEAGVLNGLADTLGGDVRAAVDGIEARLFDTMDLLSAGYYHPDQQGSYSIKMVAPALLGHGYANLAVQDGMAAVVAWKQACNPDTSREERSKIREDLLAYCGRDTELLHEIVMALRAAVSAPS